MNLKVWEILSSNQTKRERKKEREKEKKKVRERELKRIKEEDIFLRYNNIIILSILWERERKKEINK